MMEDGFLSIKWNNRQSTWAQCLADFRCKEFYTDATLTCEGRFFPVHKLILSMCSNYFREIFQRTYCKSPVVVLTGISPPELSALIDYMYNGEVEVRKNKVTEFFNAAQTLGIKDFTGCSDLQTKYSRKTKFENIDSDQSSSKRQKTDSNMISVKPTTNDMPDHNNVIVNDSSTQINPFIVRVETVRSEEAQRAFATVSNTCDIYQLNIKDKQASNGVTKEEADDHSDEVDDDILTETPTIPNNSTWALREAYESNLYKIRNKLKSVAQIKVQVDKSRSRRKKSDVWNHFKTTDLNKAQCIHCKKTYTHTRGATSNLMRHLHVRHNIRMTK